MPVRRPYFNLHQIVTGQFTTGGEYVYDDGTDYNGPYHILPTNQFFTGTRPEPKSREIFEKRIDVTADILRYNLNTGNSSPRYETPVAISRVPTSDEYQLGEMERFFVQKRNSPLNTIIEIDGIQFNKINTKNNPGINGIIWKELLLKWKIGKIPKEDVFTWNQRLVIEAENNFPGISKFLPNNLEFYR
jgi:hypothetical protein